MGKNTKANLTGWIFALGWVGYLITSSLTDKLWIRIIVFVISTSVIEWNFSTRKQKDT